MTAIEGLGMFLFGMISFATLAIVAWFVIQEVIKERKDKKHWDDTE
jgi:hypothetical protein